MRRYGRGPGSIVTVLVILFLVMVALPTLLVDIQALIIPAIILTVLAGIIMLVYQRRRWWLCVRELLRDGTRILHWNKGVYGCHPFIITFASVRIRD